MSDHEQADRPQARVAGDAEQWHRHNEAYLSAALRWLRLRLDRFAGGPVVEAEEPAPRSGRGWSLRRRDQDRPRLALPAGDASADVDQAAAAMAEAEAVDPPPALHILASRLQLSRFERDVLLLCAGIELDTGLAGLCARAQQDPSQTSPTFALALALFDSPAWEALSPDRPLRYFRLLEITQAGAQPLTTSPLRADERIVNYLKGLNALDDRLTSLLTPFDAPARDALPPSQETARALVEQAVRVAADGGTPPVVQLVGVDALSKQLVAQQAARALDLGLYRLPVELLPQQASDVEALARLWQRESLLLPIALFIDAHEHDGQVRSDGGSGQTGVLLQRFLSRSQGVFLISTREMRAGLGAVVHAVEVGKPTQAEQQAVWVSALGEHAADSPARLAGQFDLNALTIRQVVRASRPGPEGTRLHDRLWGGCLLRTSPRMDRLAERLHPVARWNDLVLPDEELALLRQLAAQVAERARVYNDWGFARRMNRGLGISALFVGESGTGKTMAAEVIANDLKLHLYRIDLSAVVSKYIGETEKNLRQLFDAAEDGGAILFFDEADALFGKRSEVRDSHDRYANIEINYLLQRMEAYRGLAILATNMRSALDEAFMRRLRFVITFPFPGREQRRAIWERIWPEETPVDSLDHDRLARLTLSGGHIANVALNAAFLAAERATAVTMPLVLAAARAEYRKLERPINEAEFKWSEPPDRPGPASGARPEVIA
ncbi:MAG: ATP-binding protein [Acidobacteria bacterium]|nr:ATP-binding protein [Acidobacteriota bacterium]